MGSKARIISHICDPIIKNKSIQTVVDLFAETGSVGYTLKPYKNVISNDLEYYAYIINQAILNGCNSSESDEASFLVSVEQQYMILQRKISAALTAEKSFFVDDVDYVLVTNIQQYYSIKKEAIIHRILLDCLVYFFTVYDNIA